MKAFHILLIIILFLLLPQISFAESNYVLPYPSSMPGNLSYKIHLAYEALSKYWYFGDFGRFDYNLKLADKYLVEAKTLFEYKQYLLGYQALKKSDQYYVNVFPSLLIAERNGKNTLQKKVIFDEASQKHIEVLKGMESSTPSIFTWEPEKSVPTTLNLKEAFNISVQVREKN